MIYLRINELLKARDWTAYRLGKESGLPYSVVSKYCNGQVRSFAVATLNRLCEVLHCNPGDLIGYTPDKKTAKKR